MSNNKQSSVEWLYFAMEGFIHKSCRVHFVEYFEKAKAMHKEEIKDALIAGSMNSTLIEYRIPQYYNETFGGNDEQSMIDYNAMEEEWEMDNYKEMEDEEHS